MPFNTVPLFPLRGFNKDKEYSYVDPSDYIDALNITHITEDGNSQFSIHNTLGNSLAFSMPPVPSQNKKYRVLLDASSATAHELTFETGSRIFTASFSVSPNVGDMNTYLTVVSSAISSAMTTNFQTATLTPFAQSATKGYIDIEMTTISGDDFVVKTTGTDNLTLIITQEAYGSSVAGDLSVIGSYDLYGDLFVLSSSVDSEEVAITPTIVAATNSTPITIQTNLDHGLSVGDKIKIDGVVGNTAANGIFTIASALTSQTFTLGNSIGNGVYVSGGTISINVDGLGEIGVASKDINTGNWAYTRLLRSKELNLRKTKQITGIDMEVSSFRRSMYFTDDFNIPRSFYYSGDYVEDGAINFYNSSGIYEYGNINVESKLFLRNTVSNFSFVSQKQSGGSIEAGNWRYSIRMLTENFNSTEPTDLTNPVSVYEASNLNTSRAIFGNSSDTETGKINEFEVTGISPNLYKYVELLGVQYTESGVSSFVISRTVLPRNATSINLIHNGNETYIDLPLSELLDAGVSYTSARSLRIIDKRMVLSNLTESSVEDFTEWAKTFTHSIEAKSLNGVGFTEDGNVPEFGEFQDPVAVNQSVGYMFNEVYRFAIKVRLKTGFVSQAFYVDDIIINDESENKDKAGTVIGTSATRRTGTVANMSLTNQDGDEALSAYVKFGNIDFDYIVNGVKVRDLIDEVIFLRGEVTNPRIVASGYLVPGVNGLDSPINGYRLVYEPVSTGGHGEFPGIAGRPSGMVTYPASYTAQRNFASFYSPDILYGNTEIPSSGDILNYGSMEHEYQHVGADFGLHLKSVYVEYNCYTSRPQQAKDSFDIDPIDQTTFIGFQSVGTISSIAFNKKLIQDDTVGSIDGLNQNEGSPVLHTTGSFDDDNGSYLDYGFYYAQFRAHTLTADEQYGPKVDMDYVNTGSSIIVNDSAASTVDVFGGDVFTQKSYLKFRYPDVGGPSPLSGYGGAVSFYTQNRVNTQMRSEEETLYLDYPNVDVDDWLETRVRYGFTYNNGYTVRHDIQEVTAFDPDLPLVNDHPARIIWSPIKATGSLSDEYRSFLPLDFFDLDLRFGEITHHDDGNGELVTWQRRKFQRQYFNTRGTLSVSDDTDVLIGDGAVLSRDGKTISVIGCDNKFSIIKGKSQGGNDVFMWINTELKKAVRFGYDGTKSIGDIEGMQSFLANNLRWVTGKDNPASGQGICGVWDDRHGEYIWTMRGHIGPDQPWALGDSYSAGEVVYAADATLFDTFEETRDMYRAKIAHTGADATKPGVGENWENSWEKLSHDDPDYYNEYTLVFNEFKDRFTTFYTYKPQIYLKYEDRFLSPRPAGDSGKIYEHTMGDYCSWYDDGVTKQEEDGYIDLLFAKDENLVKEFIAFVVSSDIVPKEIKFYTTDHETFVIDTDFENNLGKFEVALKNDILSSSDGLTNDEDTSAMWGTHLIMRIVFEKGVKQVVTSAVLKFFALSRTYNK